MGGFEQALEDRELDPLAMVFAELRNLAQPATASLGLRLDVISYQDHHVGYFQKKDG